MPHDSLLACVGLAGRGWATSSSAPLPAARQPPPPAPRPACCFRRFALNADVFARHIALYRGTAGTARSLQPDPGPGVRPADALPQLGGSQKWQSRPPAANQHSGPAPDSPDGPPRRRRRRCRWRSRRAGGVVPASRAVHSVACGQRIRRQQGEWEHAQQDVAAAGARPAWGREGPLPLRSSAPPGCLPPAAPAVRRVPAAAAGLRRGPNQQRAVQVRGPLGCLLPARRERCVQRAAARLPLRLRCPTRPRVASCLPCPAPACPPGPAATTPASPAGVGR